MENNSIYVGNLDPAVTSEQLENLFGDFGTVRRVNCRAERGFSFVEMSSPKEVDKAVEALNGSEFEGKIIRVDKARPFVPRSQREK